jgi:hypothetical protein
MIDDRVFKGHSDKENTIDHPDVPYNAYTIQSSKVMVEECNDVFDEVLQNGMT